MSNPRIDRLRDALRHVSDGGQLARVNLDDLMRLLGEFEALQDGLNRRLSAALKDPAAESPLIEARKVAGWKARKS